MALTTTNFDQKWGSALIRVKEEKTEFDAFPDFIINMQVLEKRASSKDMQLHIFRLREDYFALLDALTTDLPILAADARTYLYEIMHMIDHPEDTDECIEAIMKCELNAATAKKIQDFCRTFSTKIAPIMGILARYMGADNVKDIKRDLEKLHGKLIEAQNRLDEAFQEMSMAESDVQSTQFRFELNEARKRDDTAYRARLAQELTTVNDQVLQADRDVTTHRNTRREERHCFFIVTWSSTESHDNGEAQYRERANNLRRRQAELAEMLQNKGSIDDHLTSSKEIATKASSKFNIAKDKWEKIVEEVNLIRAEANSLSLKLAEMLQEANAKNYDEIVAMQNLSELITALRITVSSSSKDMTDTLLLFKEGKRHLLRNIYPACKILVLNESLSVVLRNFKEKTIFDAKKKEEIYSITLKRIENQVNDER
jgi:hypothetical protein